MKSLKNNSFILKNINGRGLVLLLFILCFSSISQANGITAFYTNNGPQVKEYESELSMKLQAYRIEVEKNAYADTMNLCIGYLAIKRNNPRAYELARKYHKNDQVFDKYSAAVSCFEVIKQGAANPFQANFGGLKHQEHIGKNKGFWDYDSWFMSMYSTMLVHSTGFLSAAMHCLGTMDQDEINDFAGTILLTDITTSAAIYGVAGAITVAGAIEAAVINLIARATWFIWNPVKRGLSLAAKVYRKPPVKMATWATGALVADNFLRILEERDELTKYSAEIFDEESAWVKSSRMRTRAVRLDLTLKLFLRTAENETDECKEGLTSVKCREFYAEFFDYVYKLYNMEILEEMDNDRFLLAQRSNALLSHQPLNEAETIYFKQLEGFLDVVVQFYDALEKDDESAS